jgi:hypothetical protein
LKGITVAAFVLGIAAPVRAQGEWLRRYDVPVGAQCPTAEGFERELRQRLTSERLPPGLGLELSVRRAGEAFEGAVTFSTNGEAQPPGGTQRSVRGAACAEVVQGLSLIAALALESRLDPSAGPDSASPPAPLAAPHSLFQQFQFGLGLGVLMESAPLPRVAASPALVGSLTWAGAEPESWLLSRWARWQPEAVLLLSGAPAQHLDFVAGRVQTRWQQWAATTLLCPLRLGAGVSWAVRPCATLALGQLLARSAGPGLEVAGRREVFWGSGGAVALGEVTLGSVGSGWAVAGQSWVGAEVPFVQHAFYFAPGTRVFSVPALGWSVGGWVALVQR